MYLDIVIFFSLSKFNACKIYVECNCYYALNGLNAQDYIVFLQYHT